MGVVHGQGLFDLHEGVLLVRCLEHQALGWGGHQRVRDARVAGRCFEIPQGRAQGGLDLVGVQVAHKCGLAKLGAVELAVKGLQLGHGQAAGACHHLVKSGRVAHIAFGVGVAITLQFSGHDGLRVLALLFNAGEHLALVFLQRGLGKAGVAQHVADQRNHPRQVLAGGLDAHHRFGGVTAKTHLGLELVEPVLNLLTAQSTCAFVEHGRRGAANAVLAKQGFLIAKVQRDAAADRLAACAFGQQAELHAVGQCGGLGALVNVGGGGVKGLGLHCGRVAFVVFHQRGHVHCSEGQRAHRLVGGNVGAQRAVVTQQVLRGHAVDISEFQVAHRVAAQKKQAPVALRDRLRQGHTHLLGVGEAQVPAGEVPGLGAVQLGLGDGVGADRLDGLQHRITRLVHVLSRGQREPHQRHARVLQAQRKAEGGSSQLLVHDAGMQTPRGGVAQNQVECGDGGIVRVRARWHVVSGIQAGRAAHAAHGDAFFAILSGVQGVERGQGCVGVFERAKRPANPLAHFGRVKLAGHDHRGVGGAVVGAVELLQALDVDALHIGARANRALAVVVPLVGAA